MMIREGTQWHMSSFPRNVGYKKKNLEVYLKVTVPFKRTVELYDIFHPVH